MKLKPALFTLLALLTGALSAAETKPAQPGGKLPGDVAVSLVKGADDLVDPVSVAAPKDGSGRLFVIERPGEIQGIKDGKKQKRPFLDLKDKTISSFLELGMYSMAFHPDFKNNGKVYVAYADLWFNGATLVTEYTVSKSNPDRADPESARVIMHIDFPYCNHHGGQIAFGPDGYLYIGVGDGGWEGDGINVGQDLHTLLGKMLRIDVNKSSADRAYDIPKDNPFADEQVVRGEIYASGLRNPWGLSFDSQTGHLWCADVGQDLWEEINLIKKGANYGWSWREASGPYLARETAGEKPAADVKFTDPIFAYDHNHGISITGGVVYRGNKLPELKGAYVYGDWGHGRVWALRYDKVGKKVISNDLLLQAVLDSKGKGSFKPTAFCEDASGEILALDWAGKICRIQSAK